MRTGRPATARASMSSCRSPSSTSISSVPGIIPRKDSLLGVGQIFLPRTSLADQETCRAIVESEIIDFGYHIYGWRQVPVDTSVIGEKARVTRPEIEQIMVAGPHPGEDYENQAKFEKDLYLVRRRIEKRVIAAQIKDFYICSLSSRSIIYKGLFLAESLSDFYPDLQDDRFTSRFAIFHQRYSTNTFPEWWLAQPFRCLAHNGEINTVRGNKNWMKSHEMLMAAEAFGEHSPEVKPVIPAGASDTAALDATFEVMVRSGRNAPTAKLMLIPEAWSKDSTLPEHHRAMYAFFASVMEPWDGPAALAMTDGRWMVAGVDRNALRPMRYTITGDNLLLVGSETGMVPVAENNVVEKGALGPGQVIAVDLDEATLYHDQEIKDMVRGGEGLSLSDRQFHQVRGAAGCGCRAARTSLRRAGTAPAAGGGGHDDGGYGADPGTHGGGRQGSRRLHGGRHAAGRRQHQSAHVQPLLSAEFQPGHESAHRFAAGIPRDVAEDALFELHQRPR